MNEKPALITNYRAVFNTSTPSAKAVQGLINLAIFVCVMAWAVAIYFIAYYPLEKTFLSISFTVFSFLLFDVIANTTYSIYLCIFEDMTDKRLSHKLT